MSNFLVDLVRCVLLNLGGIFSEICWDRWGWESMYLDSLGRLVVTGVFISMVEGKLGMRVDVPNLHNVIHMVTHRNEQIKKPGSRC